MKSLSKEKGTSIEVGVATLQIKKTKKKSCWWSLFFWKRQAGVAGFPLQEKRDFVPFFWKNPKDFYQK